jgi:hypothetical protein
MENGTYFSRLFKPTAVFVSFFNDLKKNYSLGLKSAHFTDSLGFRTLIVHTDNSNKLNDFHFITNYVNTVSCSENKGDLKFVKTKLNFVIKNMLTTFRVLLCIFLVEVYV